MGKWLDESFEFYASYHDHGTNQWIHIVCVPLLIMTGLVMLMFTPNLMEGALVIDKSSTIGSYLPEGVDFQYNAAFFLAAFYCVYYMLIEGIGGLAGTLAAAMVFCSYIYANNAYNTMGDACWNIALYTHIFSWVAQIVGHQVWEGRSPALLDNLFQAFIMAPLFVVMEVLFMFGYKKEFRERVQLKVDKNIKEYRAGKAKKSK